MMNKSIKEMMSMPSGIYIGKTDANEDATIKIIQNDSVIIKTVQDDGKIRVNEYYSDGTSKEYLRDL